MIKGDICMQPELHPSITLIKSSNFSNFQAKIPNRMLAFYARSET